MGSGWVLLEKRLRIIFLILNVRRLPQAYMCRRVLGCGRQGRGHHRIVSDDANYPQAFTVESILAKRHAGRVQDFVGMLRRALTILWERIYYEWVPGGRDARLIPACQDPEIQVGTLVRQSKMIGRRKPEDVPHIRDLNCQKAWFSLQVCSCVCLHI